MVARGLRMVVPRLGDASGYVVSALSRDFALKEAPLDHAVADVEDTADGSVALTVEVGLPDGQGGVGHRAEARDPGAG